MAGAPHDGAMPVTVGWFWAWPAWVACHCALLAAMVWSSTWVSRLTSPSGLAAPRLSGGDWASMARPGGSSAAVGIRAPSTRTGMTRMPRVRADSISTRTKSFGPAARPQQLVADEREQRVAGGHRGRDHLGEVVAELNRVDVLDHLRSAVMPGQPLRQPAGLVRRIGTPVADEYAPRHPDTPRG